MGVKRPLRLVYIYVIAIAGQTTGPNWLNFGGNLGWKKIHGQSRALELVFNQRRKLTYPSWSDKALKGTLVNLTCQLMEGH